MSASLCPVCSSPSDHVLSFPEATVWRCKHCRHSFSSISKYDPQTIYGEDYFNEKHQNWFDNPDIQLFERINRLILKHAPTPGPKVLDVGCGKGNFLHHLKSKGHNLLWGLDLSEPSGVHASDYQHLQLDFNHFTPTEHFEVIVTMMNIEHLDDIRSYVEKIVAMLVPGGLVVINTINSESLIYRFARWLYRFGVKFPARRLYDPHHLHHFSTNSLQKLIADSGLQHLECFRTNYPLNATDVGSKGTLAQIVKLAIVIINAASRIMGMEIAQTIVAVKPQKSKMETA